MQRSDEERNATELLLSCARICKAGGAGASLAIALVKDGLLRVAVERSIVTTEAAFGAAARRRGVSAQSSRQESHTLRTRREFY